MARLYLDTLCPAFLPAFIPDVISFNSSNSPLIKQSSHAKSKAADIRKSDVPKVPNRSMPRTFAHCLLVGILRLNYQTGIVFSYPFPLIGAGFLFHGDGETRRVKDIIPILKHPAVLRINFFI